MHESGTRTVETDGETTTTEHFTQDKVNNRADIRFDDALYALGAAQQTIAGAAPHSRASAVYYVGQISTDAYPQSENADTGGRSYYETTTHDLVTYRVDGSTKVPSEVEEEEDRQHTYDLDQSDLHDRRIIDDRTYNSAEVATAIDDHTTSDSVH